MDNNIPEYYTKTASKNFLVHSNQPKSRFFHGLRMNVEQNMGQGCAEIMCIHKGLYVEMSNYRLHRQLETCHKNMQTPFSLRLLLSGHFQFGINEESKQTVASGDLYLIHGTFEQVVYTHPQNENISALSMYLPQDLIKDWLALPSCAASKGLEKLMFGRLGANGARQKAFLLTGGLQHSSELMRIARELVYARRKTIADNLRFESLALDFLSRILTLEHPGENSQMERTGRIRTAVDEAVDILHREWSDPPNISTLARRVALNECSLKKEFRRQTGMTIGGYIRRQRMTKALEFIETGRYSILETALFVGYSNPSHFSAAFKKFYGHLPSYYLPKNGKIS